MNTEFTSALVWIFLMPPISLVSRLRIVPVVFSLAFLAMPASHALAQREQMSLPDQPGYVPTPADEELHGAVSAPSRLLPLQRGTRDDHHPYLRKISLRRAAQRTRSALRHRRWPRRVSWQGLLRITRKQEWPDWTPPPEMIQRQPYLPRFMAGGPGNPMGARALYLGTTVYRIHGTNQPQTIGSAVSSGCFRLVNSDVTDLYARIPVGTKVIVRQKPEL